MLAPKVINRTVKVEPAAVPRPLPDVPPAQYNIQKLDGIKYAPRDEFMQSIMGILPKADLDITEILANEWKKNDKTTQRLRNYAQTYRGFAAEGARLPKFTKWVSGMFVNNAELANAIAAYGKEAVNHIMVASGDLLDIMRVADTPHYVSCLGVDGGFKSVTKGIAETCTGIGVVYVNDANGKMKGRCFINHAQLDDGTDCIVVASGIYGCITPDQVAKAFIAKGIPAYVYTGMWDNKDGSVNVKFINCFTKDIHYDTDTWTPGAKARKPL